MDNVPPDHAPESFQSRSRCLRFPLKHCCRVPPGRRLSSSLHSAAFAHVGFHPQGIADGSPIRSPASTTSWRWWRSACGPRSSAARPYVAAAAHVSRSSWRSARRSAFAGVALPWTEIGIAVSVLVLGAVIALALRPPSVAVSVALIAAFALRARLCARRRAAGRDLAARLRGRLRRRHARAAWRSASVLGALSHQAGRPDRDAHRRSGDRACAGRAADRAELKRRPHGQDRRRLGRAGEEIRDREGDALHPLGARRGPRHHRRALRGEPAHRRAEAVGAARRRAASTSITRPRAPRTTATCARFRPARRSSRSASCSRR